MRATAAHVRSSRGGKEASDEAAVRTADLHLLGRLAGGFEFLIGGTDIDVAVAEGRERRRTARLVGEGEIVCARRDCADGGRCAS